MMRIFKKYQKLSDYAVYSSLNVNKKGKEVIYINLGKSKRKTDECIDKHISVISLLLKGYAVDYWYEDDKGDIIVMTTMPWEKYVAELTKEILTKNKLI